MSHHDPPAYGSGTSSDHQQLTSAEKADRIRTLLATEGDSVAENTQGFNAGRRAATAELDGYESLKAEARSIKEAAIERVPELIESVTTAIESRGGHVHLADDAAEARQLLRTIAADNDASVAVKSKSMTSEEIEMNAALQREGVEVWETDLGEFVVQLAEETPSHIVAPAIHRSREEIATLFDHHFDPDEPLETATDLTRFAREFLHERIREADIGLTGANFVAAETGTLVVVTSEGNMRKTVAGTDVHVAVTGVEKLLPSLSAVPPFIELLAKSATGQDLSVYTSFLTPPGDAPSIDFAADSADYSDADGTFHLILVDNGRMAMREDDDLKETLYCVRCGACSNACSNFQHVGGHGFGGETYSGGIATGWEAGIYGIDVAADFEELCTGCTRCIDACPVGIDVDWINEVVRDRVNKGADSTRFDFLVDGLAPDIESSSPAVDRRLFGNIATVADLASATAPISNWLTSSTVGRWGLSAIGIDPRRELPTFHRQTLVEWFANRSATQQSAMPEQSEGPIDQGGTVETPDSGSGQQADYEVILYPDVYTDHVDVALGRAAVRVLEALGADVEVPSLPGTGRAPLSQGMISTARDRAERVASALAPHLDAGRDVVVVEPSALAMLRRDYRRLLDEDRADWIAATAYAPLEYAHGLLNNGADADALGTVDERVIYHPHCQARTIDAARHTVAVLEDCGGDVVTTDVECCGMAGSFGYKQAYFELSLAVGESVAETLPREGIVAASGTSCRTQLDDLIERRPHHPLELIDPG